MPLRYPRLLGPRVQQAARFFPALVLTGARQTGKTTLLRAAFPAHNYVSLDLPSEAAAAEEDPEGFLHRHPPPLLVDEVQYAPGVFRHLKAAIDRGPAPPGSFVLTGSQGFALMGGVSESLAGRAAILELEGLAAAEIRGIAETPGLIADPAAAIHRGFYPALWAQPDLPREEFYASWVATYLERDLRVALAVGNLRDFERFLRLCAARTGQLLNKSELARDAGISTKTAAAWLSALEASRQVFLLPPWSGNLGKRLMKSPKLYVADPGLAAFLLGLDLASVRASPLAGALWETAVYAELRKALARRASARALFFYRDSEGAEVDFVLAEGLAADLIECKWSETPDRRAARLLERVGRTLAGAGLAVRRRVVACRASHPWPLTPGCEARSGLDLGEITG